MILKVRRLPGFHFQERDDPNKPVLQQKATKMGDKMQNNSLKALRNGRKQPDTGWGLE